jgi:hypothetical protein
VVQAGIYFTFYHRPVMRADRKPGSVEVLFMRQPRHLSHPAALIHFAQCHTDSSYRQSRGAAAPSFGERVRIIGATRRIHVQAERLIGVQ